MAGKCPTIKGLKLGGCLRIELAVSDQLFRTDIGVKQRDFFKAIYDNCRP